MCKTNTWHYHINICNRDTNIAAKMAAIQRQPFRMFNNKSNPSDRGNIQSVQKIFHKAKL